jgi:tetratricopeptide (TPR) repeat protein
MPQASDATLQQASAHLSRGQVAEAERLAQGVLRKQPRNLRALETLAAAAFQDARYDDARMFLGRCRKLKPKSGVYLLREGQVLQEEGRYPEALAALQKAKQLDRRVAASPLPEAMLLRLVGEREAARRLVKPLLASPREGAEAACEWAELELADGDAEAAAEVCESTLARGEAVAADSRRKLQYLHGRACEKLGRIDDAFAAYHRANELSAAPFDRDAFVELSERVMRVFSAETLSEMPRSSRTSEQPVFIIGMPRSGTTLLERIIDAHPQAAGAGELPDLTRIVRRLPQELGVDEPFPEAASSLTSKDADRLARGYLRRLRAIDAKAKRVVNKNLDTHLYVGLIALLFPGALIVHIRRDPMDIGLSCFAMPLLPENQPWGARLEDIALAQHEFDRLMAYWREAADVPTLEVQYEEFVRDQEAQSRRLIEFLDLPWDDACLRHHETGRTASSLSHEQARQPVYTSSVKRSERFAKHLEPLRQALVEHGVLTA